MAHMHIISNRQTGQAVALVSPIGHHECVVITLGHQRSKVVSRETALALLRIARTWPEEFTIRTERY